MPPKKVYKPGKKRIQSRARILTEAEYLDLLTAGKPIPQGAEVLVKPARDKPLGKLGVRFHQDGSMEVPYHAGTEHNLHRIRFLHAKTIPAGIRQVHHQIVSVKERIEQAEQIRALIERMRHDLVYRWKTFSPAQQQAFIQYFGGITQRLAKNPILIQDENKIHAISRLERTQELLEAGNTSAASATMGGLSNNMGNWLRKLRFQHPRLERRQRLVISKKFQQDTKVFAAVDAVRRLYSRLADPHCSSREHRAMMQELHKHILGLKGLRLDAFAASIKNLEAAHTALSTNKTGAARRWLREANKRIVSAASPVSAIYPDKLREIRESSDTHFKKSVLENQAVLFHDMIELWWNTPSEQKRSLIQESVSELSRLAYSLKNRSAASQIGRANNALSNNNIHAAINSFAKAVVALNQQRKKEFL